jgi:hypothetical protein
MISDPRDVPPTGKRMVLQRLSIPPDLTPSTRLKTDNRI